MSEIKSIKDIDSGTCSCQTIRVTEGEYTIEVCSKNKDEKRNNKIENS